MKQSLGQSLNRVQASKFKQSEMLIDGLSFFFFCNLIFIYDNSNSHTHNYEYLHSASALKQNRDLLERMHLYLYS